MSRGAWFALALLAALLGLAYYKREEITVAASNLLPRGLRLNNPLNIEKTKPGKERWVGEIDSADPRFASFATMSDGVRAGAKLLLNYQRLYGLNTVREIVNRWAPPSENKTDDYARNVAAWMGVTPDQRIDVAARLPDLVRAMGRQEQGQVAFAAVKSADLSGGVSRALA